MLPSCSAARQVSSLALLPLLRLCSLMDMDPIAVALLVGLLAAALFLFARGGGSGGGAPEPEPEPTSKEPEWKIKKAQKEAAKKAAAAEREAAREKAKAERDAAERATANEKAAAAAQAKAKADAAAAAAADAGGGAAVDTSNDGLLSALGEVGFEQALVSDVEGREIQTNAALQQTIDQSYGSIDKKHDITQMVRIFRNKQPSTKLAGVVYVLQEKDKSVGGTVLMLVRSPRLGIPRTQPGSTWASHRPRTHPATMHSLTPCTCRARTPNRRRG